MRMYANVGEIWRLPGSWLRLGRDTELRLYAMHLEDPGAFLRRLSCLWFGAGQISANQALDTRKKPLNSPKSMNVAELRSFGPRIQARGDVSWL